MEAEFEVGKKAYVKAEFRAAESLSMQDYLKKGVLTLWDEAGKKVHGYLMA